MAHPPHVKEAKAIYLSDACREHMPDWWPWAREFNAPERSSEAHFGARFGDRNSRGYSEFTITRDGEPVEVDDVVEVIAGRPGAILRIQHPVRTCERCTGNRPHAVVEMLLGLEVAVVRSTQ